MPYSADVYIQDRRKKKVMHFGCVRRKEIGKPLYRDRSARARVSPESNSIHLSVDAVEK